MFFHWNACLSFHLNFRAPCWTTFVSAHPGCVGHGRRQPCLHPVEIVLIPTLESLWRWTKNQFSQQTGFSSFFASKAHTSKHFDLTDWKSVFSTKAFCCITVRLRVALFPPCICLCVLEQIVRVMQETAVQMHSASCVQHPTQKECNTQMMSIMWTLWWLTQSPVITRWSLGLSWAKPVISSLLGSKF